MRMFNTLTCCPYSTFFSAPYHHRKEEKALEFSFVNRPDVQPLTYSSYITTYMIQKIQALDYGLVSSITQDEILKYLGLG